MWWDEDGKMYDNSKDQLNSLLYPDTKMHLYAYIDKMDQRMENYDSRTDQHKIYLTCMEMGQNLFDRSYYTMKDSTCYLDLWKYWADSHGIVVIEDDFDYMWDHVFM